MGVRNASVDEYIAKSPDSAQSILTVLRDAVHAAAPARKSAKTRA